MHVHQEPDVCDLLHGMADDFCLVRPCKPWQGSGESVQCDGHLQKRTNSCRDKKDALRMVLGGTAAAQGDAAAAMRHIRVVAAQHPHSPVVWNAFARAAACSGSMRSALRYLHGMTKKHPDSVPLMVLLGNSHMITVGHQPLLRHNPLHVNTLETSTSCMVARSAAAPWWHASWPDTADCPGSAGTCTCIQFCARAGCKGRPKTLLGKQH